MKKTLESERPPIRVVLDKVNSTFPIQFKKIFIVDAQNDCSCLVEKYDIDIIEKDTWIYLDFDKTIKKAKDNRISVPVIKNFDESCIKTFMRHIVNSAVEDFEIVFESIINGCYTINNEIYSSHFDMDDWVVLIKEPECFGVITANIGGIGLMACAKAFKANKYTILEMVKNIPYDRVYTKDFLV